MLRKAGDCNIEVVVIMFMNVLDEVNTMNEATLYSLPFFLPNWGVTSECQHILATVLFCFLDDYVYVECTRDRVTYLSVIRSLTWRAISTFSFGMFVHVRCMHVSMPISDWHVLTISDVSSDVRPPAFLVFVIRDG